MGLLEYRRYLMSRAFFQPFYRFFIIFIIVITIICIFFTPFFVQELEIACIPSHKLTISSQGYAWPTPGYTTVTSYYGKRISPTAGASNFHKGIDIGATEGSYIIAIIEGTITFTGFLGGGGYTITLTHENMKITYCHVSPNYIVKEGDKVMQGQVIAKVGPKYVEGVKGNPYKDETGRPTNGATTGSHLHLGIRVNENYINPLSLYLTHEQ